MKSFYEYQVDNGNGADDDVYKQDNTSDIDKEVWNSFNECQVDIDNDNDDDVYKQDNTNCLDKEV